MSTDTADLRSRLADTMISRDRRPRTASQLARSLGRTNPKQVAAVLRTEHFREFLAERGYQMRREFDSKADAYVYEVDPIERGST
jgi:hypothetical protein